MINANKIAVLDNGSIVEQVPLPYSRTPVHCRAFRGPTHVTRGLVLPQGTHRELIDLDVSDSRIQYTIRILVFAC